MIVYVVQVMEVMLYGLFDMLLMVVWNVDVQGKNFVGFGNGNLFGNCFGVKGVEDFGGGLKVIFMLENGFNLNIGVFG